jgi:hypothetical protein
MRQGKHGIDAPCGLQFMVDRDPPTDPRKLKREIYRQVSLADLCEPAGYCHYSRHIHLPDKNRRNRRSVVMPPPGGEHHPEAGEALLCLGINRLALRSGGVLHQAVNIPGLVHGVDLLLPDMAVLPRRRLWLAAAACQQQYQKYRASHHRPYSRVL